MVNMLNDTGLAAAALLIAADERMPSPFRGWGYKNLPSLNGRRMLPLPRIKNEKVDFIKQVVH